MEALGTENHTPASNGDHKAAPNGFPAPETVHGSVEMQAPGGAHDLEAGHPTHERKLKDISLSLSLPTAQVSLEWRELDYSIVIKKGKGKAEEGKVVKRILKRLSGMVRAGTFVAIMGPTGEVCLKNRF
jgi:hypothetical protein